jgi:hypothetical protein
MVVFCENCYVAHCLVVLYFSACNMEEHERIDAAGGSRKNSIFMLKLLVRTYDGLKFMFLKNMVERSNELDR